MTIIAQESRQRLLQNLQISRYSRVTLASRNTISG